MHRRSGRGGGGELGLKGEKGNHRSLVENRRRGLQRNKRFLLLLFYFIWLVLDLGLLVLLLCVYVRLCVCVTHVSLKENARCYFIAVSSMRLGWYAPLENSVCVRVRTGPLCVRGGAFVVGFSSL